MADLPEYTQQIHRSLVRLAGRVPASTWAAVDPRKVHGFAEECLRNHLGVLQRAGLWCPGEDAASGEVFTSPEATARS